MMRFGLGLVLGATLAFAVSAGARSRRAAKVYQLPKPGWMTPAARAALRQKMRRHAVLADRLTRAVIMLQNDKARRLVDQIQAVPPIIRPAEGEPDPLKIPQQFFAFQDAFRTQAQAMAGAASKGAMAMAGAFGQLAETCVKCHWVYTRGADSP